MCSALLVKGRQRENLKKTTIYWRGTEKYPKNNSQASLYTSSIDIIVFLRDEGEKYKNLMSLFL